MSVPRVEPVAMELQVPPGSLGPDPVPFEGALMLDGRFRGVGQA